MNALTDRLILPSHIAAMPDGGRMLRILMGVATIIGFSIAAHAQQPIPNRAGPPKGTNLPSGVKIESLGIEIGDSYQEATAKLIALGKQSNPQFKLSPSNVNGVLRVDPEKERNPKVTGWFGNYPVEVKASISKTDDVTLYFSSPASGSQVLYIERRISTPSGSAELFSIDDVVKDISEKLKAQPTKSHLQHVWKFKKGASNPVAGDDTACFPRTGNIGLNGPTWLNKTLDPKGTCDIAVKLFAIESSPGRTTQLLLTYSDNARLKETLAADEQLAYDLTLEQFKKQQSAPTQKPRL